ncbi:hypothetical protein BofuT4_P155290.1 [Botrytis cinerea T4]|uniref:Uncharacterized protein n=1 Tax=Botryotinia fuckeliana (strain T4) TaxID=999810 RepID=G2YV90_BOTF4|nr:hypothetical protein BofuT4_P155290.1 [Botrytis cinerea T4]
MSRTLLSVCSGHLRLHTESGTVISLRDGSTGRQVQEGPPENSPSNPVPNPNSFSPNSRACGRRFQICSCSTGPSAKFSNQDVSLTGAQTIKIWGNFDMGCAFIPSIRNDNDKTKRVCPTKFKSHATRVIA